MRKAFLALPLLAYACGTEIYSPCEDVPRLQKIADDRVAERSAAFTRWLDEWWNAGTIRESVDAAYGMTVKKDEQAYHALLDARASCIEYEKAHSE